jgi:L-ascorbate metabolism protein UlaG (beta-lactamase superfamily)
MALIDPWVMTNPKCPDARKKVARLDAIFLTHGHTDHMGDLLALAKQHKPKIVATFETYLWLESKSTGAQCLPANKGGSQKVGDFAVTMTHAFHSNSIEENGLRIYAGEAGGFIVRLPGGVTVYHAGDTAVFGDMKLLGEIYKPDVALLPIGDVFTMGPREAAFAIRWSRREACDSHALCDVPDAQRDSGGIAGGSEGCCGIGRACAETRGDAWLICPWHNLWLVVGLGKTSPLKG